MQPGIVGYICRESACCAQRALGDNTMKVSDILRVKGNTLYTVTPDEPLSLIHISEPTRPY